MTSAANVFWQELSQRLRELRQSGGLSLRAVEQRSGYGRGSPRKIENGKARPTRAQVEWYDSAFGGDGLLLSLYAEARGAHGVAEGPARDAISIPGDDISVIDTLLPLGEVAKPGAQLLAGWTLLNDGIVPWSGRRSASRSRN